MSKSVKQQKQNLRDIIRQAHLADETESVSRLIEICQLDVNTRSSIEKKAAALVDEMRQLNQIGIMETFLAEYGLSSQEGVALMCLAEALLRVPDSLTIDALIQDKIVAADWGRHLGHSSSPLVNASTWALMLTGKVISPENNESWDIAGTMHSMIKRIGDPIVRNAVKQSMRVLGHQFVLGRDIEEAYKRARQKESKGYTHTYDMLGEAAHTAEHARQYFLAYSNAITSLSNNCKHENIHLNPGISVKLSALHPRYETSQRERVVSELAARVMGLALLAKNANMSFNIDAEEADRLELSLDIIEQVLSHPDLKGWNGFGVVVQSYMPRAVFVIDWLHYLAKSLDRKIIIRLVKGAYWDSEIKQAQLNGLSGYPVFTRKVSTDICYLACARRLFEYSDHLYAQFATHNAHSAQAVLEMAGQHNQFEFQHLHGMGDSLFELLREKSKRPCRIYAPVGIHKDLLAYLVRRLLENGANSSFVNQVLDDSVSSIDLVRDPIGMAEKLDSLSNPGIPLPAEIFGEKRINSKGWNLANPVDLQALQNERKQFQQLKWFAAPQSMDQSADGIKLAVLNPANLKDEVGQVINASQLQITEALNLARKAYQQWHHTDYQQRAECLVRIADLFEQNAAELMMLMTREAGKNLEDSISEVREAVDFCRYYSSQSGNIFAKGDRTGRGVFVCISPWNFPLAIFCGQIVAAIVCGNTVIAKPAEQTPLIARRIVELMHQSGIPADVLQLLPGDGPEVGGRLSASPDIDGICFTGSIETAQGINQSMATEGNVLAPLIAETGGLNAMIVDSSALPEQAVQDICRSAFQSAGQRCSALRVLFLQADIEETILHLLKGAMNELCIGDPWAIETDIGPVIDADAKKLIDTHCEKLTAEGRLIHKVELSDKLDRKGFFVAPAVFRLDNIIQLEKEIFGPVLHVVTFDAEELDNLVENINARGYGLTMGIHTRVDNRVQNICDQARVGNIYVNRNQIGAVVGVQPFGGEGLSGTGPKAGGPFYLYRFTKNLNDIQPMNQINHPDTGSEDYWSTSHNCHFQRLVSLSLLAQKSWSQIKNRQDKVKQVAQGISEKFALSFQKFINSLPTIAEETIDLQGPTGESNRLSVHGRGVFLCLGKTGDDQQILLQLMVSMYFGNGAIVVVDNNTRKLITSTHTLLIEAGIPDQLLVLVDKISLQDIAEVTDLAGVIAENTEQSLRQLRVGLASKEGAVLPLITDLHDWTPLTIERSLSIDTTASGGNALLLASAS